jgi:hypothetical protein
MSHEVHFQLTDQLISHLDKVFQESPDAFIQSRYTGLLAVSAVTGLERSVKSILIEFGKKKNVVLGRMCQHSFSRINAKIGIDYIQNDYVKPFGDRYLSRFKKRLKDLETSYLRSERLCVRSSYGNLLTWRNEFAHGGEIPRNASFDEVKTGYRCGKLVMECLAATMVR